VLYFCDAACKASLGVPSFPPPAGEPPASEDPVRPQMGAPSATAPPRATGTRLLAGLGIGAASTASAYLARSAPLSLAIGIATSVAAALLLVHSALGARRSGAQPADDLMAAAAIVLSAAAAILGPGLGDPPRAGPGLAVATSVCIAVLLGRWLESLARTRAEGPLRRLAQAVDVHARVRRQGEWIEVPADSVRAGEEVEVHEGEVIPADGVVRAGSAQVVPYPGARSRVHRAQGDSVIAGARVHAGALTLLTTFSGPERNVVRIARIADPASPNQAPVGALAHRLSGAAGIAVGVVATGLGVGLVAWAGAPLAQALAAAAAVLAVAGPRALRLAATAPLLAAAGRSAGHGAFFRDGAAVESAGRVAAAVFAVRGTLTVGRPEVRDIVVVGDREQGEILALAAAAEGAAPGHPLGAAIQRRAREKGLDVPEPRRLAERPGQGVLGAGPRGESIAVGTRRLLLSEGVSVAAADRAAHDVEAARQTAVLVAVSDRVQAVLALDDPLRDDAADAIARLGRLGIEPVLLTGDSRGTAEALGEALGIGHVRAEVEPADRAVEIRRFSDAGTVVAVIGHPARDASALSAADVSIALGAAGAAKADASIRLAGESLVDAVSALADARTAVARSRRNLAAAVLVALVGGLCAALGLLPVPLAAAIGSLTAAAVERS